MQLRLEQIPNKEKLFKKLIKRALFNKNIFEKIFNRSVGGQERVVKALWERSLERCGSVAGDCSLLRKPL
jgi:hypothetical protein